MTTDIEHGTTRAPAASSVAPVIRPTLANVPYGPHALNVIDLWRANSAGSRPQTPLLLFIHGGGFRGGDKQNIDPHLLRGCLDAGISVASINYRLAQHALYPAPMLDSARALQFIRSNAEEWGTDPRRVAASGGSAGGGISLWLGFHEDLVDPRKDDPVARQSRSRILFQPYVPYVPRTPGRSSALFYFSWRIA